MSRKIWDTPPEKGNAVMLIIVNKRDVVEEENMIVGFYQGIKFDEFIGEEIYTLTQDFNSGKIGLLENTIKVRKSKVLSGCVLCTRRYRKNKSNAATWS